MVGIDRYDIARDRWSKAIQHHQPSSSVIIQLSNPIAIARRRPPVGHHAVTRAKMDEACSHDFAFQASPAQQPVSRKIPTRSPLPYIHLYGIRSTAKDKYNRDNNKWYQHIKGALCTKIDISPSPSDAVHIYIQIEQTNNIPSRHRRCTDHIHQQSLDPPPTGVPFICTIHPPTMYAIYVCPCTIFQPTPGLRLIEGGRYIHTRSGRFDSNISFIS